MLLEAVRVDKRSRRGEVVGSRAKLVAAERGAGAKAGGEARGPRGSGRLHKVEQSLVTARGLHEQLAAQVTRDRQDRERIGPLRVIRDALAREAARPRGAGPAGASRGRGDHGRAQGALGAARPGDRGRAAPRAEDACETRTWHARCSLPTESLNGNCPTCGQALDKEAHEHAFRWLRSACRRSTRLRASWDVTRRASPRHGRRRAAMLCRARRGAPPAGARTAGGQGAAGRGPHKLDAARSDYIAATTEYDEAVSLVRSDEDMEALELQVQARDRLPSRTTSAGWRLPRSG